MRAILAFSRGGFTRANVARHDFFFILWFHGCRCPVCSVSRSNEITTYLQEFNLSCVCVRVLMLVLSCGAVASCLLRYTATTRCLRALSSGLGLSLMGHMDHLMRWKCQPAKKEHLFRHSASVSLEDILVSIFPLVRKVGMTENVSVSGYRYIWHPGKRSPSTWHRRKFPRPPNRRLDGAAGEGHAGEALLPCVGVCVWLALVRDVRGPASWSRSFVMCLSSRLPTVTY